MSKIIINKDLLQNSGNEDVETDVKTVTPAISANDFELIDFDGIYEADRYGLRYGLRKSEKQLNK